MRDCVLLDYGSGGLASHRLITELFLRHFANPTLAVMDDAALLPAISGSVVMSTDSYVVDPIIFPGGDIGSMAVHGTINDVAMLGAQPLYLSCAFILEEGLPMELLTHIVRSMGEAAAKAGVPIVTGDTKVVPKGACDKIFINTTGIGKLITDFSPSGHKAEPGDAVLISGSVGDHGLTILAQRENLPLAKSLCSDSAALHHMVAALLAAVGKIHVLRDPTRGGLATTLNEIVQQSNVHIRLTEPTIPVKDIVATGCSLLGIDPLYLANEGKLICILPEAQAEQALAVMRSFPAGQDAMRIGTVSAIEDGKKAQLVLQTKVGGLRRLGMLEGMQFPRIC